MNGQFVKLRQTSDEPTFSMCRQNNNSLFYSLNYTKAREKDVNGSVQQLDVMFK